MQNDFSNLGGLRPTPKDKRDFKFSGIFGLMDIKEVPEKSFIVAEPLEIKNQGASDLCTAYALAVISEAQEKVKLNPQYTFAKTKQLEGEWQSWGADLRTALKSGVEYGFLPETFLADDLRAKLQDRDFIANWENWGAYMDTKAYPHRKKAYFSVDGPYSLFDNLRATLWQNREEKRLIFTGATWQDNWTYAKEIDFIGRPLFGHAFVIIGQEVTLRVDGSKRTWIIVQNSGGPEVGDKGLHYFSSGIVNKEFSFGSYTYRDLDPEVIKRLTQRPNFWARFKGLLSWYFK